MRSSPELVGEARWPPAAALWATVVLVARLIADGGKTKLATKAGARYRDGIHFADQGGQIRSLLPRYRSRHSPVPT